MVLNGNRFVFQAKTSHPRKKRTRIVIEIPAARPIWLEEESEVLIAAAVSDMVFCEVEGTVLALSGVVDIEVTEISEDVLMILGTGVEALGVSVGVCCRIGVIVIVAGVMVVRGELVLTEAGLVVFRRELVVSGGSCVVVLQDIAPFVTRQFVGSSI